MDQQFTDLPQEVKEQLERILAKSPTVLIQYEIDLLKSRRDYLNSDQLTKFAMHLGGLPKAQTGKKNNKPATPRANATQYKEPAQEQSTPSQPNPAEAQQQASDAAAAHEELVTEANSLNIQLEGNETDEQLAEAIAFAKEEDLAKAKELGIDTTGMEPVGIMNAIAEKEAAQNTQSEEAEGTVHTEDVQDNADTNAYAGGNADPDSNNQ